VISNYWPQARDSVMIVPVQLKAKRDGSKILISEHSS
jgi:hypothetical protein